MISGSIQITPTEPKWYHYVAVCLHGKGKVRWTGSHYEDETYADLSVAVWGNKETPQPTKLIPVRLTFRLNLPSLLNAHQPSIHLLVILNVLVSKS